MKKPSQLRKTSSRVNYASFVGGNGTLPTGNGQFQAGNSWHTIESGPNNNRSLLAGLDEDICIFGKLILKLNLK